MKLRRMSDRNLWRHYTSPADAPVTAYAPHLQSGTTAEIASDLLVAMTDPPTSPIPFSAEPSPERQVFYLFRSVHATLGEKLKSAVSQAIAEWDPLAHGVLALQRLARVAAFVRSTRSVRQLAHIVLDLPEEALRHASLAQGFRASNAREALVTDLMRVMLGFRPDDELRDAFERLLFSEDLEPRFTGLALVGACKHAPERFIQYVVRFLDNVKLSGLYSPPMEAVIHQVMETVTLQRIADHLNELPGKHRRLFHQLLCCQSWSPARLTFMDDQAFLIDCRPYVKEHRSRVRLPGLLLEYVDDAAAAMGQTGAVGELERALSEFAAWGAGGGFDNSGRDASSWSGDHHG